MKKQSGEEAEIGRKTGWNMGEAWREVERQKRREDGEGGKRKEEREEGNEDRGDKEGTLGEEKGERREGEKGKGESHGGRKRNHTLSLFFNRDMNPGMGAYLPNINIIKSLLLLRPIIIIPPYSIIIVLGGILRIMIFSH